MPPKLPLKSRDIVRKLKGLGFEVVRVSGSHQILKNSTTNRRTVVPKHAGDLPKGTVKAILREAGISLEEFLERCRRLLTYFDGRT